MTDTSWLEIDLVALRRNIQTWRQVLTPSGSRRSARLCGVLKADGYGCGAGEVARCLQQAGADMLAVYSPAQADALLEHPLDCPILLLMPVRTKPETARLHHALLAGQLHLSVDSPDQLVTLNAIGAGCDCRVPIHLALDTGMSRGGLCVEQFGSLLRQVKAMPHVKLAGIWTHFAAADSEASFTEQQFTLFRDAVKTHRDLIPGHVLLHAGATHATLRDRRYHLDMARIGLGLYGYGAPAAPAPQAARGFASADPDDLHCSDTGIFPAFETVDGRDAVLPLVAPLRPAIRWRSRIVHVRKYSAGATVGYNCTARLARDSFLGLVPVGYADGYPLSLSNKGQVRLSRSTASEGMATQSSAAAGGDVHVPILGRVNMDQVIIDLTPDDQYSRHGCAPLAQVGDVVDMISSDPASPCFLPTLAAAAGTSPYEMLCRVSPRIPRVYLSTAPAIAKVAAGRLNVSAV